METVSELIKSLEDRLQRGQTASMELMDIDPTRVDTKVVLDVLKRILSGEIEVK